MKKSSTLFIAAALILSSCGTMSRYASSDSGQRFTDGIYGNTPAFRTRVEKEESKSETQALVEKTKESPIYLFGDKKDTVMIPEDMSATIRYDQKLGGTVVTVAENTYDWRFDLENNYGYYYGTYSPWYRSRYYSPWYSWTYSPWRYYGWYDPWYYGSYYDPWYYGGWYDPWYYSGCWGWHSPWYHHHHHYHHHHPHHGPAYMPDGPGGYRAGTWYGNRYATGSDRIAINTSSSRRGSGRSTISRTTGAISSASSVRAGRAASSSRSSAVRTSPASRSTATAPARVTASTTRRPAGVITGSSASSRPGGTVSRTGAQTNYRRPAASAGTAVGRSDSRPASNYRSTTSSGRQSYSSPSGSSSSSSYSRNSSSSSSRSSYSSSSSRSSYSSGSSRSSYSSGSSRSSSGGGSYSRSGGRR